MTYNSFPYIFGSIVANVQNKFAESDITPFYDFGTTVEVINRLKQKTDSVQKYPLIWYLIDGSVTEDVGLDRANHRTVKSVTVIICNETDQNFTSDERYQFNFIPILRPIYDALISEITNSRLVRSSNGVTHQYHENLFWGKEGLYGHVGNIADDRLDAIVITGLDLMIIENCN